MVICFTHRYCAHEYERSKDMASAALAYKCTEVAYMRVVYSSHSSASRDRQELQTALQMAAPGKINYNDIEYHLSGASHCGRDILDV